MDSEYTQSSDRTKVEADFEDGEDGELHWRKNLGGNADVDVHEAIPSVGRNMDWDPAVGPGWNRDTLVGVDEPKHQKGPSVGSLSSISQSPERRPMMPRQESSKVQSRSRSRGIPTMHNRAPSELPFLPLDENQVSPAEVLFPEAISSPEPSASSSWLPES